MWQEERLRAYVRQLLHVPDPLLLGLYEDGALIGISLGRIKHWCAGVEYWIDEFGVLPQKQGQGVGSAFLKQIKAFLAEMGIHTVALLTERTAPAYAFYLQNGFFEKKEQAFLVWEE